jgi:hypothetical protein
MNEFRAIQLHAMQSVYKNYDRNPTKGANMGKVLTAFAIALLLSAPRLFAQDQAEFPAYKNGDSWVYRSTIGGTNPNKVSNDPLGDYELTYTNGKILPKKVDGEQRSETTDNMAMLNAMFGWKTFTQALEFPLSVGKKWNFDSKFPYQGRTELMRSAVEVTKIEEVTTPAGKFRAFKLERIDISGSTTRWDRVYYYSPETKSIVKFRLETRSGHVHELELIKFTAAK